MKRLLLLLPAGVGFALLFWRVFQTDLSIFKWLLPPLFMGFVIQAVVLRLTRKGLRWLRIVPLGLLALPALAVAEVVHTKKGFWPLGVILYVAVALSYLLGWGAAWGLEDKSHA